MSETLDRRESSRALEILGRELDDNRPTRRQELAFRLLNWDVLALLLGYAVTALGVFAPSGSVLERSEAVGTALLGLSVLAMPILLLLNLGLVRQLWRTARARKRLGLSRSLQAAFRAQRRKHRLRNLATGMLAVFGLIMMVVTTLSTGYLGMGWSAVVLIMVVLVLFLSFVSIHYIRRGMERIAVVEGLRDAVSRGRNEDDEVEVSGEAYDLIANMERDQIIRERQSRLQRAAEKRPDEFGYAVQTSFAAQDAKGLLPEDQGGLVDAQIQRLARDPGTDRARSHIDGRTKLHRLSVEGAPVSVEYEIDDQAQVVRVMRIEASPPGGAGDARVES